MATVDPLANLVVGAFVALVVAGAFIVANATNIALWKYLLAVIGLIIFVAGGLAGKDQRPPERHGRS